MIFTLKKILLLFIGFIMNILSLFSMEQRFCKAGEVAEITPYKYTETEDKEGMPFYTIPGGSIFPAKSLESDRPYVVYYFTQPKGQESYPIAIVCGGSSTKGKIRSIIHFHRYFLQEFLDLGMGVLTVEQRGINGPKMNENEFREYYTWSQRLKDHKAVIESLIIKPPVGWNKKIVFLGVSEGGPLVTTLTQDYPEKTLATINWCGAGDWAWQEELWLFIEGKRTDTLECQDFPKTKDDYDRLVLEILENPVTDKEFLGMTYKYLADAFLYPAYDYEKLQNPFLVVAGTKDTILPTCDAFVQKALDKEAKITYFRIEGMDHYVRHWPNVIKKSFEWLEDQVHKT